MTTSLTDMLRGRQVVVFATNQSGGAVAAGDVVVFDTANDEAFTTTTSANFLGELGIVLDGSIAAGATGRVVVQGYVPLVNVNASVTRGHYGATYTVAKRATDAGAARTAGTFCQFLKGGTSPSALIYPVDLLGSSLTNPMSAANDIIIGGTLGAPGRLASVASSILATDVSGVVGWAPRFTGAMAYSSGAITLTNAYAAIALDGEYYDSGTIHDNVTNNSRFTVPAAGYYVAAWAGLPTTSQTIASYLRQNGSSTAQYLPGSPGGLNQGITSVPLSLAANDYLEFMLKYVSGAVNLNGGSGNNWFAVYRVG